MYIFYPVGGLANRMRVIDSAYKLSSDTNRSFRVFWKKDKGLNCDFNSIWLPKKEIRDTDSKLLHNFFKLRRKSGIFRVFLKFLEKSRLVKVISDDEFVSLFETGFNFKSLKNYRFCVISSFSHFYKKKPFFEMFELQPENEKLIDLETAAFDQQTIGVHIRRTDNKVSIEHSPLEFFIDRMKKEQAENPGANFYLATDDPEVKSQFKNLFGEKLITPQGKLSRDNREGIIQAVVEMYALSRSSKIYGSYFSSFTEVGGILGDVNTSCFNKEKVINANVEIS